MTQAALIDRLEAGAVGRGSFGHREHLQAAYELLRQEPFLDASLRFARAIEAFAHSAGAAGKFNLTMTIAFLSVIAERMAGREFASFECFLTANPGLLEQPLAAWYSAERLGSPLARRIFLLPDRGVSGDAM